MKASNRTLGLFLLGAFLSCGHEPSGPFIVSSLDPAPVPDVQKALIVGLSGEVSLSRGNETIEADLGTELLRGDVLTTGSQSSVDLQLSDLVQARLLENTTITLNNIFDQASSEISRVEVGAGTLVSKVKTLVGQNRYSVSGPSFIAGVRGTLFLVQVLPDGTQKLSVAEGSVAVSPEGWNDDTVEILANATAQNIEGDVLPVLTSGKEISVPIGFFPEDGPQALIASELKKEDSDPYVLARNIVNLTRLLQDLGTQTVSSDSSDIMSALASSSPLPSSGSLQPIVVQSEPADAQVELELSYGQSPTAFSAQGRYAFYTTGASSLTITASRDGYETAQTTVELDGKKGVNVLVRLVPSTATEATSQEGTSGSTLTETEPTIGTLAIQTQPPAEISINGMNEGRTPLTKNLPVGSEVVLTVKKPGFEPYSETFIMTETISKVITLQAQPLLGLFPAGAPAVGATLALPNGFLHTDTAGRLTLLSQEGAKIWSVASPNATNENSVPIFQNGILYFSGISALLGLRATNGVEVFRVSLDSSRSHTFGQRPAFSRQAIVSPTSSGLEIYNNQGVSQGSIPVNGAATASPAFWGEDKVLFMSQSGELNIASLSSRNVELQISTPSQQVIASAPLVIGNQAFVVSRTGLISKVLLLEGALAAQLNLSETQRVNVTSDMEPGSDSFFVFARNKIFGVSTSLQQLFEANATSQALFYNKKIYYGEGRSLVVADATTGRVFERYPTPEVITAKPAIVGDYLAAGTDQGKLAIFVLSVLR